MSVLMHCHIALFLTIIAQPLSLLASQEKISSTQQNSTITELHQLLP